MLEGFRKIERFKVAFSDVDMLRHVNNLAYMRWAEQLRSEYFYEVLLEEIGGRRGMILANATIAYELPLTYREQVAVGCRVARIGNKSFDFAHEVWSIDRDLRAARIQTTLVAMDYENASTIAVPDAWRERVAAFELTAVPA